MQALSAQHNEIISAHHISLFYRFYLPLLYRRVVISYLLIFPQQDTKPLLDEYEASGAMLKPTAIMTGQAADEGGWCQRARKHLTLEETGKDSLPLSTISDTAVINVISSS